MTNDFKPTASIEVLKQRARLLQSIRQFFDQRDFFEVETPILSHDVVVDRYLEPISIHVAEIGIGDTDRQMMWLQTSPEFSMKRLLASGAEAIYQITRAFRAGEVGAQHNTEFAMLEWYRVGDDMQAGMSLLAEFAETIPQTESCELISYRDAFQRYAGIDPFSDDISVLANSIVKQQIDISGLAHETDIDEWRNLLLTHLVEPQLGIDRPVIVYDWPATQSALAVVRDDDPPVAERFELYFRGVELANGYHELLDANELAQRNRSINQQRRAAGKRALPEESRLLAAMQSGLPPCSGVALGIDRLMMVMTGNKSIEEVLAFPVSIA